MVDSALKNSINLKGSVLSSLTAIQQASIPEVLYKYLSLRKSGDDRLQASRHVWS